MYYLAEHYILIFLIQIFLILGLARGLGEIFQRLKQPAITAEILVGIFLGPTILGRFFPSIHSVIFPDNIIQQNMLETVAWFGILFFLLKTGLEMDFSSAWRQKGDALKIAFTDLVVPMVLAFIPCLFISNHYFTDPSQKYVFAIFVATVMMISALPVTARVLNDLNLYKTDLGFLIMCALSVNDILGWMIFTLILGFFTRADIELSRIAIVLVTSIGFTFLALTIGRTFTNYVISKIKEKKMPEPSTSLTFISLLGFLCGVITLKIGIYALFGFFIAGVMAGEAKALSEKTRHVISQMVHALFVPVFFASVGLKVDFLKHFDMFMFLFITVVGISGRFLGAWLGVTFTRQPKSNRLLISIAHTPGGEMQIVVGMIALGCKLITEPVFVAIVFGAIISSVILGPWMSYAMRKRKEVSMLEFISRRSVISELTAKERDRAISELCRIVSHEEHMPTEEEIYSAVMKRENEMGTAIGHGVAIPHARLPGLRRPVIAFARSITGVEWDSPDGEPVYFVFFIMSSLDDNGIQLQILRFISRAMRDKEIRAALEKSDGLKLWDVLYSAFTPHYVLKK